MEHSINVNKDGRIKIVLNKQKGEFRFSHENMDLMDMREVCKRIALYLRKTHIEGVWLQSEPLVEGETDPNRVCVAFNHNTKSIQVAVTGLDYFTACQACDNVVSYLNALLFPPHSINELSHIYKG